MGLLAAQLLGWDVHADTLLLGAMTGLSYGILAAGLVLIYRATKVINLAHGEIGAFGAALLAKLVLDLHWNYFVALIAVLIVGGVLGAVLELAIIRRLFRVPRLVLLVATIGMSQLVFVLGTLLPDIEHPAPYPTPLDRTLKVGSLVLRSEHFMVLAFVPAVVVGLWLFLSRTPFGIAIRASADNADRADLAAIPTKAVSTVVWSLAGVLATLTVVLLNPLRGTSVGLHSGALGSGLLLRALAAALVGSLTSLPLALLGGLGIGIAEAVVFANSSNPGIVDVLLFVLVLVLVVRRGTFADDGAGTWSLTPRVRAIPERLRAVWWVRRLNLIAGLGALALAAALPLLLSSSSQTYQLTRVLIFALVGLSVTVLTGWTGQLSLGQFAFVGLGAVTAAALVDRGMGFPAAVGYATVASAIAALVVGFPALRVRGPFLAVTTLGFAVMAQSWLFSIGWFQPSSGSTIRLPRTEIFGVLDLHSERTYYAVCLVVLVLAVLGVSRLRGSGAGRSIIAVRENESAAAGFTVSPTAVKLTAFAFAGALAGMAGALLAGAMVQFQLSSSQGPPPFGPQVSLQIIAMTVIGGLGSVGGAVIGAVYVVGLPAVLGNSDTVTIAASGLGLLVLLLYLPGGLMQVVYRARDVLFSRAERSLGEPKPALPGGLAARALPVRPEVSADRSTEALALRAEGVRVGFGGKVALYDIDVQARRGEVVGLIGSNGAGKSTLMNVVSGSIKPEAGRIELWGTDVTSMPPHLRAAHGMGRVFQDARLFGDLTVRETVKVALEAHGRSEFVPSLLSLPPSRRSERSKSAEASSYIDFLGLGRYADAFIADLSTGTRRIVEMSCLLAQGAQLLLLDEPTAGVAQRETEAFGPLIKRIQAELGATIVIIEHDIPLVMSISDRMYCLAAGVCIAEGHPADVRDDPGVVAAYLGTDERAITRSGVGAGTKKGR